MFNKNNIEKFNDNSLTDSIQNLSDISKQIMNNDMLTIPSKRVTIQNLDVSSLNILPKGSIIAFNSQTPPIGWVLCDGSKLQDGTSVPDLRGRFILGYGHGPGLSSHNFQSTGGVERHTLNINELPSHNHSYNDRYYIEHHDSVGNQGEPVSRRYGSNGTYTDNDRLLYIPEHTGNNGYSQSHENMPPYYVLTYIMKT